MNTTGARTAVSGRHVVVVGAGGNIGSHLVRHLARLPNVTRLTLVDPDTYSAANLATQDIAAGDVGRRKVRVQARALRRIAPSLRVDAHAVAVEELPLGRLRGDLIFSCLDTRIARAAVNERAWRLGLPWLDAGVLGAALLARVTVYRPGRDAPCIECGWSDADYAALEQPYPCHGEPQRVASGSPSYLGALAACLQAIECASLLCGPSRDRSRGSLAGSEWMVDARTRRQQVSRLTRQPGCRFDHETWRIERLAKTPATLSLHALLAGHPRLARNGHTTFAVAGQRFALRLRCAGCGATRTCLRLAGRLPAASRRCLDCGAGAMDAGGFDRRERVSVADVRDRRLLRAPLARLGLVAGDVVTLAAAAMTRHVELGASHD